MVGFPLLLIPLAVCNIIVFLMPGVSLTTPLASIPLMSGVIWSFTLSDVLLAVGILLLLMEVAKGARPGAKYLTDHLLSFIVFGAAAAEFVLLPQFGSSTFFLLALLAGVEFLSSLSLRVRRPARVAVPVTPVSTIRTEPEVITPPPVPRPATDTPVLVPSAAPIAESVLADKPAPIITVSPANHEPSEIPSPGLQPGEGPQSPPEGLR